MSRPAVFMQPPHPVRLRPAGAGDLDALNGVIEHAAMAWNLAERVKRLSLPTIRTATGWQRVHPEIDGGRRPLMALSRSGRRRRAARHRLD
jgi:hypothetical protein